jgi:two-component system LytT family response regulator
MGRRRNRQPVAANTALATAGPKKFVRVHRSVIVNVDFVREIHREGRSDGRVLMANGDRPRMTAAAWRKLLGLG